MATLQSMVRGVGAALVVVLAGCSSVRPWINEPMPLAEQSVTQRPSQRDPSILVAVTLSGGGARAAAFGFGVLTEMQNTVFEWNGQRTTLLDATDVVSGVSGGSIVAAYYAAHGIDGLPRFEHEFLRQNFQNSLITQALRPGNLIDLTSPWLGRTHLLARRLDELYAGKTFGDVEKRPRHPQLFITATDMSLGTGFEFTWDQFALICSDLRTVPLSFAVAASSAVPLLLSPMTLKNHADQCTDRPVGTALARATAGDYRTRLYRAHEQSYLDARRKPYIHLVDGGLSDNLGVQRLLDRALAGGGLRESFSEVGIPPGSIRKLVLITVNAERDPSFNIDTSDKVPDMFQVVDALLFGTGARATRETQEFLRDITEQWRKTLATHPHAGGDVFAPNAEIHVVPVNLRDSPDDVARPRLLQIPTAFSIEQHEVTDLIEAGGSVLRHSPEFRALVKSLPLYRAPQAPPQ
ncbi:putative esterase of the alpha-beta hydrolase superfamily [Acidovorax sp. CF316]|uniref:patatin-like phospholipase family protein n=1 Tax=Acidovorax sp. CF316 TaxID=1144317 RepID=UPI00026BC404|nr:patatin-like phospholipase family protein [Acidovorax sp. CF316]EJE49094.1 putative esterase of the alpha-beta hydrolase superfamily [Acidovorax sp. CF316]